MAVEVASIPSETALDALGQPSDSSTEWKVPERGSILTPEEAHRLLTDAIQFNPQSIPSSGDRVLPDTPLVVGQDLQVKWGNTWWAGTIVGLEADGRVRVHYFGWSSSYDELKTRSELQLDRHARVRAIDGSYKREGAQPLPPANQNVSPDASALESLASESTPASVDAQPDATTAPEIGSALTSEEANRLLTDTVIFNPQNIANSGQSVFPGTPLAVGQDLQIKWHETWWAGTITGFETDGRVRVHYFGWSGSHDEVKDRSELNLDPDARIRALDVMYKRKGW